MGAFGSQPVVSMQVRDRRTGQLIDEHVPAYLRTVYRLMYQNPFGRTLCRIPVTTHMLRLATFNHGPKMDDPASVSLIPVFVKTYGVNLEEVELAIDQYPNFNAFFARRLKAGARPLASLQEQVILSPADSRIVVFPCLDSTEKFWLKGKRLSLLQLFDIVADEAEDELDQLDPPATIDNLNLLNCPVQPATLTNSILTHDNNHPASSTTASFTIATIATTHADDNNNNSNNSSNTDVGLPLPILNSSSPGESSSSGSSSSSSSSSSGDSGGGVSKLISGVGASEVNGELRRLLATHFRHPAIAIARLAPNDYHRWHLPVSATPIHRYLIDGHYFSVSPRAVRNFNVLTVNKREIHLFHSDLYGYFAMVAVGAAMVSSINVADTVVQGKPMNRGDEHGFFLYGGSTVVLLFDSHRISWDHDLLQASKEGIEVLVRQGERIGIHSSYVSESSSGSTSSSSSS